jgi:hypothetical protein
MGYSMSLQDQKFLLKRSDAAKALEALKELFRKHPNGPNNYGHFSWIETKDVLSANSLQKAMRACRWGLETNGGDDGDFDIIEFDGEKLGDDELIFSAIAPFVKDDSFVEMRGEDGSIWKWVFKDGKVKEKTGKVVFED